MCKIENSAASEGEHLEMDITIHLVDFLTDPGESAADASAPPLFLFSAWVSMLSPARAAACTMANISDVVAARICANPIRSACISPIMPVNRSSKACSSRGLNTGVRGEIKPLRSRRVA